MLEIFKFISQLLAKIVQVWQKLSIKGFRPFWYLIGVLLLTIFGAYIRGLLFSGVAGSSMSKVASKGSRVKVSKSKKK